MSTECNWGDIVLIDIPIKEGNHLSQGKRPAIVVSNTAHNRYSQLLTVIPLTSQVHKHTRWEYVIVGRESGLKRDSLAMCDQINTIDRETVICRVGNCSAEIMAKVLRTLDIHLSRAFAHEVKTEYCERGV